MRDLILEITFSYIPNKKKKETILHFNTYEKEEAEALCAFFQCVPYYKLVSDHVGGCSNVKIINIKIYPEPKGGVKID